MMTALTYGLYCGAVSIALTLLLYFTGLDKTATGQYLGYLSVPFMAWFIFLASKERKEEEFGGTMTYGQGVGTGALVGLFAGVLVAIFMIVYMVYINTGFIDMVVEKQEAAFRASKKMTEEDMKKALSMVRAWTGPSTPIFMLLGNVLFATLISLITSIFVRTKDEVEAVKAV